MTLYVLKVHLQTFLYIPITQKCQILCCDTLVANERFGLVKIFVQMYYYFNVSDLKMCSGTDVKLM